MSTDVAVPAEPVPSTSTRIESTDAGHEAGPESSLDTAEGSRAVNDDEARGIEEAHSDLDAYRNSRRLSRPVSRIRHSLSPTRSEEGGSSVSPRRADEPPSKEKHEGAPLCMIAYTHRVEGCTESIQAWSARQEEKTRKRKALKFDAGVIIQEDGVVVEPKGDSWLESNMIILVVAIILSWIYIVFTWRICVAGIRMEQRAVVTRAEGIGLLVGFNVVWLMTIWTYVRVIMTPPGFVRDHVAITDAPPASEESYSAAPETYSSAVPGTEGQQQGNATDEKAMRGHHSNIGGPDATTEEMADPSLPAIVGPLGAGQVAKVDEEQAVMSQQVDSATPWTAHAPPINAGKYGTPEPFRGPASLLPPFRPSNLYCYRCKRIKPPRAHHCRRCATCVLQMDHHCPWVGGCVGARNHKYFYHFLQWVTALEYYVIIIDAIAFHRGIKRRSASTVPGWSIDGYMISMFPICAMFILFTTALLITHSYLFMLNLTTIEHLAYDRMQVKEDILLTRYLDACKHSDGEKLRFNERLKEKKRLKTKWAQQWGNLKSEANVWWLDDRDKALSRGKAGKQRTWYNSIGRNWRQAVGDAWYQSFLPVGRAKSDGLSYDMNWRFGEGGAWRPRAEWEAMPYHKERG